MVVTWELHGYYMVVTWLLHVVYPLKEANKSKSGLKGDSQKRAERERKGPLLHCGVWTVQGPLFAQRLNRRWHLPTSSTFLELSLAQ